jgi:4,5-DOPA dioxygenase extradiol
MVWREIAHGWAEDFDAAVRDRILAGDHEALIGFERLGAGASLAVPTPEHYLPLLYILALQVPGEGIEFFLEKVAMGSIGMRSLLLATGPGEE